MTVHAICDVLVVSDLQIIENEQSPAGKPFLRLTFEDGTKIDISTNLAEMIGGVGTGLRKRGEDRRASPTADAWDNGHD